ncbi:MAG: MogA/MoaB family molybdenum cofactor biosynthesis protein [Actinomycetota bacterium]|nr:MogA/MoaB family molybdenum cofactor biosynthesis protein [Actinomycetota bacterium]
MRVAVLTVSDAGAAGQRPDQSGPAVAQMVTAAGFPVVGTAVVPDERELIEAALCRWADDAGVDLVLTTGGTGLGPRDVTPEATRAVIHREVPGIPEAMRAAGMRVTPYASLARQVAGQRGATLIVNLPGSPKAARESLEAVIAALPHAVSLVRSRQQERDRKASEP